MMPLDQSFRFRVALSFGAFILLFAVRVHGADAVTDILEFSSGTLQGWTVSGSAWAISPTPMFYRYPGDAANPVASSLDQGEQQTGVLTSPVFTIADAVQSFRIAGWDGKVNGWNDGTYNNVIMRSSPDGAELFRAHTPGQNKFVRVFWDASQLLGRQVYLEVVDNNPRLNPGGFAWIAFADYHQGPSAEIVHPVHRNDLYALRIDSRAQRLYCRSLLFQAADPSNRGTTNRQITSTNEIIPMGTAAETIYLLGMINNGWDQGVAHWDEHPELNQTRLDLISIGSCIGTLKLHYADNTSDSIPLVIGATAWYGAYWLSAREPFDTRSDCRAALDAALKVQRETKDLGYAYSLFYLAIKPRAKSISSLEIEDNSALRGRPLISAVTLAAPDTTTNLNALGGADFEADDLAPRVDVANLPNWNSQLEQLKAALYTSDADLPQTVEELNLGTLDAARLHFVGSDRSAGMLSNIWVANLKQMEQKFDRHSGLFNESSNTTPNYNSYTGYGGWAAIGGYYGQTFSRSADHMATVVMRAVNDPIRWRSFIDYVDKYLYYYRPNHDLTKGPSNDDLDVAKYPANAPPHWSFGTNAPLGTSTPLNELAGAEEMEGHSSVMIGRWLAWRLYGMPGESWMTTARSAVYNKSRWQSTIDAAEFICWLMDYTGRDVIWSEGEATGWGGPNLCLLPAGMANASTTAQIKQNYQQAEMFETYASFMCHTALRCSAEMADVMNDSAHATRWRSYAQRITTAMKQELTKGTAPNDTWRNCRYSVFPLTPCSLAQAWGSMYLDGYDPTRWDATMARITRNSFNQYLSQTPGTHAVLGMGYGQGWLAQSALMLDEMDAAGELLVNLAKYSYDKNMTHVDAEHSIDWRDWLWLIPEGTNLLPDGHWYRIGDLTNGANQGIAMHAIETCAGIDDCDPQSIKILPRVPDPLRGLEVSNYLVLIPSGGKVAISRVSYQFYRDHSFTLQATQALPSLVVRLGPYATEAAAQQAVSQGGFPSQGLVSVEHSGSYQQQAAWWIRVGNLSNVTSLQIRLDLQLGVESGIYYQ